MFNEIPSFIVTLENTQINHNHGSRQINSTVDLESLEQYLDENKSIDAATLTLPDNQGSWRLTRAQLLVILKKAVEDVHYRVTFNEDNETTLTNFETDDASDIIRLFMRLDATVDVKVETIKDDVVETDTSFDVFIMDVEETDESSEPVELPQNKQIDFDVKRKTTRDFKPNEDQSMPVAIMREAYDNVEAVLEQNTRIIRMLAANEEALTKLREKQRRPIQENEGSPWLRNLTSSFVHVPSGGFHQRTLNRDDAVWRQQLEHEGRPVRPGFPVQKLTGNNHSDEEIIAHIQRKKGIGAPHDTILPYSGFKVRFKPAMLSDFTRLQYILSQLRVNLGNQTKGMAFSNISQTLKSAVVDFCLEFVTDANIDYKTPSDIKERIYTPDQDIFIWGFACTLYPNGFPYSHSCLSDPCTHVVNEIMNLHNLFWLDSHSLTRKQTALLSRGFNNPLTDAELTEYHNEHSRGNKRIFWFEDGTGLELKVPTLLEYEIAGKNWIDNIIKLTSTAFSEPAHGSQRSKYIDTLSMATTAQQYSHWVNAIYDQGSDDGSEPVFLTDRREGVEKALGSIFSEEEYLETFFDEVTKFIDDSIVGVIAVDSFDCPSCETPLADNFHERFPHLVALDVLSTFFTLRSRKLNQ